MGMWLVDCKEVLRVKEGEGTDVDVVLVPKEVAVVEVILDDIDEPATADGPGLSIAENGYGSSDVVRLVSQQLGPPRPWPAAPAQHQLLPFGLQRLTSPKPSN